MFLFQLYLQNFRNYPKSEFHFSPELNLIVGPNTIGKTNLLEAIYFLATAKSFRAQREKETVNWDKETAYLKGQAEKVTLEAILTKGELGGERVIGKKLLVNGVARHLMDFVGNLKAVYFGPENLQLITDSPSLRRGWLDAVLEQVDRDYRRASLIYTKALRVRNKLLLKKREEGGNSVSEGEMAYWDNLLLENGPLITQKREELINFLNGYDKSEKKIVYDRSQISHLRLKQYAKEEVAAGVTLVGPQRDDFSFELSGRNLGIYGSRGEQRLAILWLKLGELEFVTRKCSDPSVGSEQDRPILLLDDIFSELDHKHRHYVLKIIPKQQTIITTTDLHLIEKDYQKKAKMIELG